MSITSGSQKQLPLVLLARMVARRSRSRTAFLVIMRDRPPCIQTCTLTAAMILAFEVCSFQCTLLYKFISHRQSVSIGWRCGAGKDASTVHGAEDCNKAYWCGMSQVIRCPVTLCCAASSSGCNSMQCHCTRAGQSRMPSCSRFGEQLTAQPLPSPALTAGICCAHYDSFDVYAIFHM